MKRSKVHVMGASGSGTTTLARALADAWSVPHADSDDYLFVPSDPPYVEQREPQQRLDLMRALFAPRAAWVLSGSLVGWGEPVVEECDAVVFLQLDPEERLRRLAAREERRRDGGVYDPDAWRDFMTWASGYDDPAFDGRSLHGHEAWLAQLSLPVLRLDSRAPTSELLAAVLDWEPSSSRR